MTLEDAIKILTLMGTPDFRGHTEDILAARKLGIEALKGIQVVRELHPEVSPFLLPGETQ